MRKLIFFMLISIFILTGFCKKKDGSFIKEELKNGIRIVYNPELPLKGKISLKIKEISRIEATEVDDENPPGFGEFHRDESGNVYIKDYRGRRVLKFDNRGKFLFSFGREGEGPGEFKYIRSFKIIGDELVVWGSRKFSLFDINGKFIEEKKVKKSYYPVSIVGKEKFIVNFYKVAEAGSKPDRYRINALIDGDENILSTFFSVKNAGSTLIKKKNFVFAFSSSDITKEIIFDYDDSNKQVYVNISDQYRINIKNPDGKTERIIERKFKNIRIGEDDKDKIVSAFNNISEWQKKIIKENLPEKFCAISSIKSLPGGYILVSVIKGAGERELDLFDERGRFIYILEYPENFFLYPLKFEGEKLAGIMEGSENDSYIEYEILNYGKIFELK